MVVGLMKGELGWRRYEGCVYINIGGYSKVVVVLVLMKENWRCGVCLHKYRSDRKVDLN